MPCPECAAVNMPGKLYASEPGEIVLLHGSPIVAGTRYSIEKLRCALCCALYTAPLPPAIANRSKYDETCRSAIVIARYYSGLPFKRLESLQAAQGVPLADATQWEQAVKLYTVASLVHSCLERGAANGQLMHYDDTGHRILAVPQGNGNRTVQTTAFVSTVDNHLIYLFYTSQRHAGGNFARLLEKRTTDEELMTMTDAHQENIPKELNEDLAARWILCFCLVHGRRKFYEICHFFTPECEFVLDIIGKIYDNEAQCKQRQLTPSQRLRYHQEHSAGPMEALRIWFNNQLLFHQVEENSGLGQAIRYMLKHWEPLTQFLRVPGAPIDNSICEQAIKVVIRHRRNSLFYKTFRGAEVGDCLMSVLHTAARNGANIFDYLNTLQRHEASVRAGPEHWLPWNYQDTVARLNEKAIARAA